MNTISVSIDVKKIDKTRFFEGKKGTYMDLILIPTPGNKYGNDYLVKQDSKKDENVDLPILGNAKNFSNKSSSKSNNSESFDDEAPF